MILICLLLFFSSITLSESDLLTKTLQQKVVQALETFENDTIVQLSPEMPTNLLVTEQSLEDSSEVSGPPVQHVSFGRYILVKSLKLSWEDANQYCSDQFSTRLADVIGFNDINQIYSVWKQQLKFRNLWIGLYDQNEQSSWRDGWKWATGVNYNQQNFWRGNEPDKTHENCGIFWSKKKAKAWDAGPCHWKAEFLCSNTNFVKVCGHYRGYCPIPYTCCFKDPETKTRFSHCTEQAFC